MFLSRAQPLLLFVLPLALVTGLAIQPREALLEARQTTRATVGSRPTTVRTAVPPPTTIRSAAPVYSTANGASPSISNTLGGGGGGTFSTRGSGTVSGNTAGGAQPTISNVPNSGAGGVIPAGFPFSGRTSGGSSRTQIFGDRRYGSGLGGAALGGAAGAAIGSVAGANFPFGFWPLYFGPGINGNDEYGPSDNSSRPGGSQSWVSFNPSSLASSSNPPPQYEIFGDQTSTNRITSLLQTSCSASIVSSSPSSNNTLLPAPKVEDAVQFYRASSFALMAYFQGVSSSSSTTASTFYYPSNMLDQAFQDCVNRTIGENLPIVQGNGVSGLGTAPSAVVWGLVALVVTASVVM